MNRPRLKAFIYLLLRDEATVGAIERILTVIKQTDEHSTTYSNKFIEQYADDIVERILDE